MLIDLRKGANFEAHQDLKTCPRKPGWKLLIKLHHSDERIVEILISEPMRAELIKKLHVARVETDAIPDKSYGL